MRHYSSSQNTDGYVKHCRILNNFFLRYQPTQNFIKSRFGNHNFIYKTGKNHKNKTAYNTFNPSEAFCLKEKNDQYVYSCNHNSHVRGIWNRRFKAIAEPITSARSQAAMAISQNIQRMKLVAGLK